MTDLWVMTLEAFVNGNKRTAWGIMEVLLLDAGYLVDATPQEVLELVSGIDNELGVPGQARKGSGEAVRIAPRRVRRDSPP